MTRNQLMKGGVIFVWINKQHLAYNTFRNCLLAPAVVGHFDEDAEMESHTNTSNVSLGAVLVRTVKKKKGIERVIAYASFTASFAQKNYSATEKECLAIVRAIIKFQTYL